jgi:hypothetical protein
MKIYTTVEPVPSRMLALVRLLAAAGHLSRDDIEGLQQPRAETGERDKKPEQARKTLEAALECGLVEEDKVGGTREYRLAHSLTDEEKDATQIATTLPKTMARILLHPGTAAPTTFATKCAWFLTQPVPPTYRDETTLITALGQDTKPKDIDNPQRLDMLVYWMTYMGLGHQLGGMFLVDPTELIRAHLDTLLPRNKKTPIQDFIDKLSGLFPVFDGGKYFKEFAPKRETDRLSQALSLAIARLSDSADISFGCTQDARIRSFLDLGPKQKAREIEYLKRSGNQRGES